jgi:enoyl-[acyl-carrier protein] reductase I
MGILEGRSLVITGVLTEQSIAFHVARIAQEEGATVLLTGFGRGLGLTKRVAGRLSKPVEVLELDVTNDDHLAGLAGAVSAHMPVVHGVLHSIGYAPESALGGNFLNTSWADVATAMQVSAYSLKSLTAALTPVLSTDSAVVGLDFDATVAWPTYDWMGVAKAALEATARYLARDLGAKGIRVNLVSAGPIRTVAATHIPGFSHFEELWTSRAPLGWDVTDPVPAAKGCVALLSPWFSATSGEIVHVDGGFHSQGA